MKTSEILLKVTLDDNRIPEKIEWQATDSPYESLSEAKAVSVALWDPQEKSTLRIDLWTKEMMSDEIKHFYLDCVSGIAQSLRNATNDEKMSAEIENLCQRLAKMIMESVKSTS